MRIGLVLQTSPSSGGAFGYENQFMELAIQEAESLGIEVITFSPYSSSSNSDHHYRNTPLNMVFAHLRANTFWHKLMGLIGLRYSHLERRAQRQGVDFLVFASPNHQASGVHHIPFATTAWDFGHLDRPQGSEVALGGLWAWRETLYSTTLRRSLIVFCDSAATRDRLREDYGVVSDRIYRLGLLPSVPPATSKSAQTGPYLIYPAMFWPHKNHLTLIQALELLRNRGEEIPHLVFTGTGELQERIKDVVNEAELQSNVHFKGLVSREELSSLIAGSAGLLMPSLIGPSNLPPLEAALLNVPSVISDVHQMEDLIEGVEHVPALDSAAWSAAMMRLIEGKVPLGSLKDLSPQTQIASAFNYAKTWLKPWNPRMWHRSR